MINTPRTHYERDRLDHWFNGKQMVYSETAEQLETELSEALRQLEEAQRIIKSYRGECKELHAFVEEKHAQLAAAQEELKTANGKLKHLAKCVEISEKINDGRTDAEVQSLASLDEAMAYVILEETERERDSLKSRLAQAETERDEARASEAGYADQQGAIMQENSILKSRLAEAEKVLDVFARCYRLMQPLNLALDTPMQDCCPRAWTFLSHLKAADDFLSPTKEQPIQQP